MTQGRSAPLARLPACCRRACAVLLLAAAALSVLASARAQRAAGIGDACPARFHRRQAAFDQERSHELIAQARALHATLADAPNDDGRHGAADRDVTEAKIVLLLCQAFHTLERRGRLSVLGEAYRRAGESQKATRLLSAAQALEGGDRRDPGGELRAERRRGGVNGVIVFLVSPREGDVADLSHSLELLDANFFEVFERCYDVVIFHDGLSQQQQGRIQSSTLCPLRLAAIDLRDLPPTAAKHAEQAQRAARQSRAGAANDGRHDHGSPARKAEHGGSQAGGNRPQEALLADQPGSTGYKFAEREALGGLGGYRYMCRFFAGAVFELDILNPYEYYMRLDSDSYLIGQVRPCSVKLP